MGHLLAQSGNFVEIETLLSLLSLRNCGSLATVATQLSSRTVKKKRKLFLLLFYFALPRVSNSVPSKCTSYPLVATVQFEPIILLHKAFSRPFKAANVCFWLHLSDTDIASKHLIFRLKHSIFVLLDFVTNCHFFFQPKRF